MFVQFDWQIIAVCRGRTKYVHLRAHFVRDMIKDQVIEINFVKSAENDSDIMTKNQQGQHYMYAKSKLVYTVQEMNKKKAIEDIEDEETGRMLKQDFIQVQHPSGLVLM